MKLSMRARPSFRRSVGSALVAAAIVVAAFAGRWTAPGGAATRWHHGDARRAGTSKREIPPDVEGTPLVVDGDTIEVAGVRVRLFGIDAPERDQSCRRGDGSRYACGQAARDALVRAVAGSPVRCVRRDIDPYGRMVALCTAAGADLGATLVEQGEALAYRHFSRDYVGQEERARSMRAGLWQGTFERPWDWRHDHLGKHGQRG